jgi:hypothetical protein
LSGFLGVMLALDIGVSGSGTLLERVHRFVGESAGKAEVVFRFGGIGNRVKNETAQVLT